MARFLLAQVRCIPTGKERLNLFRSKWGWLISMRDELSSPLLVYDRRLGPLFTEGGQLCSGSFTYHFVDVIRDAREHICFPLPEALCMVDPEWSSQAELVAELEGNPPSHVSKEP